MLQKLTIYLFTLNMQIITLHSVYSWYSSVMVLRNIKELGMKVWKCLCW